MKLLQRTRPKGSGPRSAEPTAASSTAPARGTAPATHSAERGGAFTGGSSAVATQDWLPLADLKGGCLIRPDGATVGGIAVSPLSLTLKSENEKRAIVGAVHAALNGLQVPFEILSLYRPVDLDSYLASLDGMLATAGSHRKQLLRDYLAWVHGLVRSGEAVERRYYLLVTRTGQDAVQEHRTSLRNLAGDLMRARGMQARVMTDADWRELLFLTFHSGQAAVEQVPDGLRLPPTYRGGIKGA